MRTRWHDVSSSCTAGCRKFIGTKTSSGLWVCLCARVCSRAHTKDFRADVLNNSNCHPLPAWPLRAALQVRVCVCLIGADLLAGWAESRVAVYRSAAVWVLLRWKLTPELSARPLTLISSSTGYTAKKTCATSRHRRSKSAAFIQRTIWGWFV